MSWADRIALYKEIEEHRGRPLIVYVTSKRHGAESQMSSDAIPYIIKQLDALPKATKKLDFLIVSYGGDPMVAWRIITLIRQRVDEVTVMIPQSAYSAATLLAFGANEIIMHPNGHLGPVDMQIVSGAGRFSTEDISAFLEFVRDTLKITDQEHIRALFEATCKEIGTLVIGFSVKSAKLAVDLGERLLALHMKDDDSRSKLRAIVETMCKKFQSHGYPVNRKEALDIGLPVSEERDEKLEEFMWRVWLSIEEELKEGVPFDEIVELLNSTEAPKLLSAVPQLDIPMTTQASGSYQTTINDAKSAAQTTVEPVDYEYTNALVESRRKAYADVTKGKILSCRTPNLVIQYNRLITSKVWGEISK